MADSGELDNVKKLVRSILISSKDGVAVDALANDYFSVCNEPLPFKKLKFPTVSALMDAIDVAYIRRDTRGVLRYYAKADETTEHILRLVRNQKSTRKTATTVPRHVNAPLGNSNPMQSRRPTQSSAFSSPRSSTSSFANPISSSRPQLGSPAPAGQLRMLHTSTDNLRRQAAMTPPLFPLPVSSTPVSGRSFSTQVYGVPVVKQINEMKVTVDSWGRSVTTGTSQSQQGQLESATKKFSSIDQSFYSSPAKTYSQLPHLGRASPIESSAATAVTPARMSFDAVGIKGRTSEATGAAAATATPASEKASAPGGLSSARDSKQFVIASPELIRQRLQEILAAKPNGIRLAGLAKVYRNHTNQDPPANLEELVRQWTDILKIEETMLNGDGTSGYAIVYGREPAPTVGSALTNPDAATELYKAVVVKPFPPVSVGSCTECCISHLVNIHDFYMQIQGSSVLSQLMVDMQKHYKQDSGKHVPVDASCIDSFCAVKDVTADAWFRGCIKSIGPETADVLYIDVGSVNTVPLAHIRPLAMTFTENTEIQVMQCSLSGFSPADISSDKLALLTAKFREIIKNERLTVVITAVFKKSCRVEVDIYLTRGMSFINDFLRQEGTSVVPLSPLSAIATMPVLKPPRETFWNVSVSFVETHATVVVQILGEDYSKRLEYLTREAQTYYTSPKGKHSRVSSVTVGNVYMVATEDSWYRMRVLPSSLLKDSRAHVLCTFLDYGDVTVVSLNDIYELAPQFMNLACQAVTCTLEDVDDPAASEFVANQICKELCLLTLGKSLVALVHQTDLEVIESHTRLPVTLYDTNGEDDVNISAKLAEVAFTMDQSDFKEVPSSNGLGTDNQATQVIDSTTRDPAGSARHRTNEAGATGFIGHVRPSEDTAASFTSKGGQNALQAIGDVHVAATAAAAAVDVLGEDPLDCPLSLSPLAVGRTLAVYVTHASSPSYFAAVPSRELKTLGDLVTDMSSTYKNRPQSIPVPTGVLCIGGWYAAYLSDGRCYRVKVLQVRSESPEVNVYVVDFGEYQYVAASSLMSLAKKFKNFPPLALQMKLAGVKPVGTGTSSSWSSESCKLFSMLTVDKHLFAVGISMLGGAGDGFERTEVKLIDTSHGDVDVDIGKALISIGHAESISPQAGVTP